ncbi:MAG: Hsp33 family molecular chaperone HslO [Proteobacteria bacterium]|nr:Hsp33 family molecular chaperone HslO [Pseudomonadota bacterium]NDC23185.1 Hsp33 family molecular chaperone HslO [Pseudomonadota bacterium]NDD03290.1 Hsp33 family molecular chaperone HslO [Pseudomonadota bacterium]NDG27469.1 Hsp33 family molecular chaperone HslO [Pseudomonadota bacterium]
MNLNTEKVHKFYTEDLAVRASVVISTGICREICSIHQTFPLATMAVGRLLTGTLLMASQLWEQQSLSVRLEGSGALGHLYAESAFEGTCRAYVQNPQADIPHLSDGRLDLKSAIGEGVLVVNKNIPFQRQSQMGIVPIVSGEIGEDLAFYLQQSHQIPSIVSLSVSLDKEGKVTAAGGVLIELIPGAPETIIKNLEDKIALAGPLSVRLQRGDNPREIIGEYLHNSPIIGVEHEHPIRYSCRCSMEKVEKTLTLMGKATLAEMALKGENVGVKCEFCGKQYQATVTRIKELLRLLATE